MSGRAWRRRGDATLLAIGMLTAGCGRPAEPPVAFAFEALQPELLSVGGTLVNAWADVDGDGDLDLFVGFNGDTANRLYRNDDGVLTDVAGEAGLAVTRGTRAAAWGDADGDGDPDLLVGFVPGEGGVLRLMRNEGGRFTDATIEAGLVHADGAVRQPAWVDVDADGDLDLFVAFRDQPNALYRNDGGRFTDVAAELGLDDARRTVGASWFDFDADGDLDLVVGNMDGDANGLFRNDGGRFVDVAEALGVAWGGRTPGEPGHGTVRPCVADVDRDGRFDLFFANYGPNGLFLNRGDGRFEDVSAAWGIAIDARYDTCAFADVDLDGRIDLYVNGTVTRGVSYRDTLFRHAGDRFEDVTPPVVAGLEADHGVQWADVDGDGAIDLALTGAGEAGMHAVLRNASPVASGRWSLQVSVTDQAGRPALPGAAVCAFETGTARVVGCGLVDSGSGYNSQSVAPVHVGVPGGMAVDVEVSMAGRLTRVEGVSRDGSRGRLDVRAR